MQKTLRSPDHERFRLVMIEARRRAGLTQEALAAKLGRPQSFVAKYEGGERRIDVVEFLQIAQAMDTDAAALINAVLRGGPAAE